MTVPRKPPQVETDAQTVDRRTREAQEVSRRAFFMASIGLPVRAIGRALGLPDGAVLPEVVRGANLDKQRVVRELDHAESRRRFPWKVA